MRPPGNQSKKPMTMKEKAPTVSSLMAASPWRPCTPSPIRPRQTCRAFLIPRQTRSALRNIQACDPPCSGESGQDISFRISRRSCISVSVRVPCNHCSIAAFSLSPFPERIASFMTSRTVSISLIVPVCVHHSHPPVKR